MKRPIRWSPLNHIVPEWYYLPFYAILRAVPDKLLGVVAMFGSIMVWFVLPWLDTSKVRSAAYRPIFKQLFWLLMIDFFILGIVGANPPEGWWITVGQIATVYYFAHFLILLPLVGLLEDSQAAAVIHIGCGVLAKTTNKQPAAQPAE